VVVGSLMILTCMIGIAVISTSDVNGGVPAYRLFVDGRVFVAEVDTMPVNGGLRQIFDDIRQKHSDIDGGYFVRINCSTGGAAKADNRLANGRYAVGRLGAAQTGLPVGGSEFSVNEERTCVGIGS
jgi:energy-converting hydrogenase Eha subunit B